MYRDDGDAALARLASVQSELRAVTAEIAELEALRGPCTSTLHAEQIAKLDSLNQLLSSARTKQLAGPQFPALEAEMIALRSRLVDLELLTAGPAAMQAKLDEHERAIAAIDQTHARDSVVALTAPASAGEGEWVWMPRRSPLRRLARAWVTGGTMISATVLFALFAASAPTVSLFAATSLMLFGGLRHALRGRDENALIRAQVDPVMVAGHRWANATRIEVVRLFEYSELIIEFRSGAKVKFVSTEASYEHVLEYVHGAVAMYRIPLGGDLPTLLPATPQGAA